MTLLSGCLSSVGSGDCGGDCGGSDDGGFLERVYLYYYYFDYY